jgi:chromosomal replication initiator protein
MQVPAAMPSLWDGCQSELRKLLSEQQYRTWIQPLEATEAAGELHLAAPNRFVLEWVRDKFLKTIENLASEITRGEARVSLALREPGQRRPAEELSPPASAPDPTMTAGEAARTEVVRPLNGSGNSTDRGRLNPLFTFDTFVAGKANQLARAAAIQVAEHPGSAYNPLFIYGGVGLGKTHLIQAIGNTVLSHHPQARIRYIHAEQYVSDVVRAYQHKSFDGFKKFYHSLDLLLIDDIQFFSGKNRTQEEFFYAFNALIDAHKQVIITCDTYPREIEGMEDRLISRFGWGLTVAIEPPELEMRVAILLRKAESEGVSVPEDVAFFIATHIQSNVRELEGALKRVFAFCRFNGATIGVDSAREALRDLLAVQTRQITVENIQKTVADYYKLKVAEMYSKKRSRTVARPRQIAMALAKELTDLSLPDIGDAFGGRDHTTVLHACRKVAELRATTPEIARDYDALMQVLRG